MNTLQSYGIISPFGKTEECALFTIDDISVPFTLHDIAVVDNQYTLSLWIKSDAAGRMSVYGKEIQTSTAWVQHKFIFTADSVDVEFVFPMIGSYYIYHPKLEIGNTVTDWTEAPEDVDHDISNVQSSADTAQETADKAQNDIDTVKVYTYTALSVDGGNTLTYFDFSGYIETGTLVNGNNVDSSTHIRSSDYVKVSGSYYSDRTWNIVDSNGTVIVPDTHLYTYDSSTETYTYYSTQSGTSIMIPAVTDVMYLRFTAEISDNEASITTCELTMNALDAIIESQIEEIHIGTCTTLNSHMSLDPLDYTWELTDASALKNATALSEDLKKQLYGDGENKGDIKAINDNIDATNKAVEGVDNRVKTQESFVVIDTEAPSISLVSTGDIENPGNRVEITDKKISFYNGETEGAYIGYVDSEQTERTSMAVSKTYVTEMYPRVEDPSGNNKWIGNFCWIARSNGHYSLKVVK